MPTDLLADRLHGLYSYSQLIICLFQWTFPKWFAQICRVLLIFDIKYEPNLHIVVKQKKSKDSYHFIQAVLIMVANEGF